MENTITINNQNVLVKQYKRQRVLTFKDIDTVHGRITGTARKRFNDNKKHFIEGEDYFVRNSDEARKEFKTTAPNGLILLTESGYLMLAKSFTDDLAWRVQRQLVNCYFKLKEENTKQLTFDDIGSYKYIDKTYKGQPVLSIADISNMANIERSTLGYAVRRYLKADEDYYLLEEAALTAFKQENPKFYKQVRSLYVITASGFEKLCKIYGIKVEKPKLFIEEKLTEKKVKEYCIIRDDKFIQEEVKRCKDYLVAISVEIDRCNRYNVEKESMEHMRKNLFSLACDLESRISILAHTKLRTTTELKL